MSFSSNWVCNKADVLECRLQLPPDEAHVDAHLKELHAAIQVLQHDIEHYDGGWLFHLILNLNLEAFYRKTICCLRVSIKLGS